MSGKKKQRRWQIGDFALCSCSHWSSTETCEVTRGGHSQPPEVLRDGVPHACTTAILARQKIGRPLTSADHPGTLARIDPELAEQLRVAASSRSISEREFLEVAIRREVARLGKQ